MDKDQIRTLNELFARPSELPTVTEVQTELDRLMQEGRNLRELYADVSILALHGLYQLRGGVRFDLDLRNI